MKRIIIGALALVCSGALGAQAVSLDDAIAQSAKKIDQKLNPGTKIVVLNFKTSSPKMAEYVIEELVYRFVDSGKTEVIERKNLDLLKQEMKFQMSGDVSDASAQSIGNFLGAQVVIAGSLDDSYRFHAKAIAVESAQLLAVTSFDLARDSKTEFLLGKTSELKPSATATAPSSTATTAAAPAAAAKPAVSYGDGSTAENPLKLPYRVISLRGKAQEWDGVEPIRVISQPKPVGDAAGTDFVRFYLCKDDRYLYARFDFASANPIQDTPRALKRRIACTLDVYLDSDRILYLQSFHDTLDSRYGTSFGVYDMKKGTTSNASEDICSTRLSPTMCELKIPLAEVRRFVKGPVKIDAYTAKFGEKWEFTRLSEDGPIGFISLD